MVSSHFEPEGGFGGEVLEVKDVSARLIGLLQDVELDNDFLQALSPLKSLVAGAWCCQVADVRCCDYGGGGPWIKEFEGKAPRITRSGGECSVGECSIRELTSSVGVQRPEPAPEPESTRKRKTIEETERGGGGGLFRRTGRGTCPR
jgi:hypothetical protein